MSRFIMNQDSTMIVSADVIGMVWVDVRAIYAKLYTTVDENVSIQRNLSGGVLGEYPNEDIAQEAFDIFMLWLAYGTTNTEYAWENCFTFPVWDKEKECFRNNIPVA